MVATSSLKSAPMAGPVTPEELCRMYASSVCRFAAMTVADPAEAEDLAQDALLRAVRGLGSYDPARGSMEAWLWRIVANAARDAANRRQRLRDLIVRLGVALPRETHSVEDAVLSRMRDDELRRHLSRLPLRDRTLLALRYGADLDMHQVGAAVGLNSDSAARAVRRALARLKALMEEPKP